MRTVTSPMVCSSTSPDVPPERREVPARGASDDPDSIRIQVAGSCVDPQEADGGLHVMDLSRKRVLQTRSMDDGGDREGHSAVRIHRGR
jgi:hypothetical protein